MKRILFCGVLLLAAGALTFGQGTNINSRPTRDWWTGNGKDIGWAWAKWANNQLAAGSTENLGTGKVFYVDSGVANAGDGSSWTNAKATLDEAVALCTANNGDRIYVAAGHNENWSAVDSADLDVAGITVIGCGTGTDMPRFDFDDTDPELVIGAANIRIVNLAFLPSVTAVVHAVEIEADADGSVIENCWFMNGEASGTDEFIDAIQPAALADNITVVGCRFDSYGGAGANTGIDMTAGVLSDWKIWGNYFNGDYAEAPIYSDNDVHLRAWVEGNVCQNTNAGNFGIEFGGAATGVLVSNYVYTDAVATAIDPGSLSCFGNFIINTVDLSAYAFPPVPAIGTVTAGSAEDILKKLYYGADGTDAYPATVANDSTIAKIMAKGATATASTFNNTTDSLEALADTLAVISLSAIGDKVVADMDANSTLVGAGPIANEVVTHMDANSTQLAAIVADTGAMDSEAEWADLGSTLVDNIVAAIDANSTKVGSSTLGAVADEVVTHADANSTQLAAIVADTGAMDSAAEWDVLGSTLKNSIVSAADANSTVLYWAERTVYTTCDEVTEDLFTVTGGPILITSMVGYVDVLIGAGAQTIKLWVDTTAGASYDQDFSTAVNFETDAIGTTYVFSNANPSVLTPLTPGSNGASTLMTPWFCPAGTVEQLVSGDPGGAGGDHITWYMTYKPLKTGVTVAGVSP